MQEQFSAPRPKVLLIDDDPQLCASLRRNFKNQRFELIVATHGSQGIVDAIAERPDLIVTDLQMPYISGESLIEFLTNSGQIVGVPILVITGRWGAKITSRMRKCNVRGLLHKPFDSEELAAAIKAHLPVPVPSA